MLDGVYRCGGDSAPTFGACWCKTWARPAWAEPDADGDVAHALRPLQTAAVTYRIAFGPRAGKKMLNLRGAAKRTTARARLEQLCCCITRPVVSDKRVQ